MAVEKVFLYSKKAIFSLLTIRPTVSRADIFLCFIVFLLLFTSCKEERQANKQATKPKIKKPLLVNAHSDSLYSAKIDTTIADFIRQWNLKGVSVAISQDEKLAYAKGFGYADIANNEMVSPQHLFRIASVSKLITATATMKLVEEKKLKLTDKVFGEEGILNEYTQIKDARALQIEIGHLLTHTSGWKNKFRTDPMFIPLEIAEYMKVKPPINLDVITQFMLSQKMLADAGHFFDYSNFGYCLLGRVIERKTGMSYENFVKTTIFDPIGIKEIQLARNYLKNKAPLEVMHYEHWGAKLRPAFDGKTDTISRPYGIDIETLAPAGGWLASPRDLLRFLSAIDDFPKQKDIIGKDMIELMTSVNDSLRTIGWRHCKEDIWVRTGSLVGTQIVMARQKNGISWVFVSNTSSWRAHRFSNDIISLMEKVLSKVPKWKQEDLFDYQ